MEAQQHCRVVGTEDSVYSLRKYHTERTLYALSEFGVEPFTYGISSNSGLDAQFAFLVWGRLVTKCRECFCGIQAPGSVSTRRFAVGRAGMEKRIYCWLIVLPSNFVEALFCKALA